MPGRFERAVRSFITIDTRPAILLEPAAVVTDLQNLPRAYIEWGGESDFVATESGIITNEFNGVQIIKGGVSFTRFQQDFEDAIEEEEAVDEEEVQETDEYREIERTVVIKRVTNPSDPAQFLDFEDAKDITFRGPEGRKIKLVFRPDGTA